MLGSAAGRLTGCVIVNRSRPVFEQKVRNAIRG